MLMLALFCGLQLNAQDTAFVSKTFTLQQLPGASPMQAMLDDSLLGYYPADANRRLAEFVTDQPSGSIYRTPQADWLDDGLYPAGTTGETEVVLRVPREAFTFQKDTVKAEVAALPTLSTDSGISPWWLLLLLPLLLLLIPVMRRRRERSVRTLTNEEPYWRGTPQGGSINDQEAAMRYAQNRDLLNRRPSSARRVYIQGNPVVGTGGRERLIAETARYNVQGWEVVWDGNFFMPRKNEVYIGICANIIDNPTTRIVGGQYYLTEQPIFVPGQTINDIGILVANKLSEMAQAVDDLILDLEIIKKVVDLPEFQKTPSFDGRRNYWLAAVADALATHLEPAQIVLASKKAKKRQN